MDEPNLRILLKFIVAFRPLGKPLAWVANGWCTNPRGWQGRTNQKSITFDGFKGAVPQFSYEKKTMQNLIISVVLSWAPGVNNGWHVTFEGLKGAFPLFLVARTQLYKPLYWFVGQSIWPSFGPSVGRSLLARSTRLMAIGLVFP